MDKLTLLLFLNNLKFLFLNLPVNLSRDNLFFKTSAVYSFLYKELLDFFFVFCRRDNDLFIKIF